MPSIDILGTKHFYKLTPSVANSQKPVLVFLHGWLLSHQYWQPLVENLKSEYQCLVYDLRGFGNSQSPNLQFQNNYNLRDYGEDLCYLLNELNINNVWLIGHSLGGSIALSAADIDRKQISGVICLNSGGGIYLKEEFDRFRKAGQQLVKFRPFWLRYIPGLNLIFSRLMVYRSLNYKWGRQRLIDFLNADAKAAKGSLLDSTTEEEVHNLPRLVARLQQPVHFIAGLEDTVMEPKYVRHLASFHSLFGSEDSNVSEISECGHFAMLEQTEAVTSIIKNTLAKHLL